MLNTPFHIQYQTIKTIPRDNLLGRVCQMIANHPAIAGLICGLSAVAIAFARAHQGAMKAPIIASILAAIVIVVWMVLFMAMRSFFRQQTLVDINVIRTLSVNDSHLDWTEHGKALKSIDFSHLFLFRKPNIDKTQGAIPVLLHFQGDDSEFCLETRMIDTEASQYIIADPDRIAHIDEQLPPHVISPLLTLAREQNK